MLKVNAGSGDRFLRFLIGLVLVGFGLGGTLHGVLAIVAVTLAVVLFATAFVGYCPLYALVGASTRRRDGRVPKTRT